MKKICIAIGLIMAINTSWAQISVDDDYFSAFVEAQKSVARERDSLDNLELLSRVAKFDSIKVVVAPPKPVEKPKVIETPKVVKKENINPKPVVVQQVKSIIDIQPSKPIKEPFNKYYIEDSYQMTGESVFSENRLIGFKFETILRDKSYFLLKLVKQNISLDGNRMGDYFIGTYFVPYSWWYQSGASVTLTYDFLEYIKDNFQIKYKNEN
jgi:hypothetical protein